MSKGNRRVVAPAVVGVTALVATGVAQLTSIEASASPHRATAHTTGQPGSPGSTPASNSTPSSAPTGCQASSSPDYGCGKLTVDAVPVASTYPAGQTPDLSGVTFDITGPVADSDTVYEDGANTCMTDASGSAASNDCPESVWGMGTSGNTTFLGTWVAGDPFTVALDTSGTNKVPADSIVPGLTGNFPDCTSYQETSGYTPPSGCPDGVTVSVYGTYHRVGLKVTNPLTHKPIEGATYDLCSATTAAPVTGGAGCPTGSSVLASATSGPSGNVVFPSLYLGSDNYSVVPTAGPKGYKLPGSQRLEVPAVTTVAEAGSFYFGSAALRPVKTTLATQHVTVTENRSKTFNALARAKNVVSPLKLLKLGKPTHGSARHTGGKVTFKPRHNFVGTDRFTYTVRNGVGATSTGTIVVRVKAAKHHKR